MLSHTEILCVVKCIVCCWPFYLQYSCWSVETLPEMQYLFFFSFCCFTLKIIILAMFKAVNMLWVSFASAFFISTIWGSPKSWCGDLYLQFSRVLDAFFGHMYHILGIYVSNFLASGHIILDQILDLLTSEAFWSHDSTQMRWIHLMTEFLSNSPKHII